MAIKKAGIYRLFLFLAVTRVELAALLHLQ